MRARVVSHATRGASRRDAPSGTDRVWSVKGTGVWSWILLIVLGGAVGSLYIGHALRMQEEAARLNSLELELMRARREHTEVKLLHDRMTGPNQIYRRATQMGFVSSGPADVILTEEAER